MNVPKTWVETNIGEISEVVRGGSPRPMGSPKYFEGRIPFVKISDVTKEPTRYLRTSVIHVNEEGAKKSRLLKKGSLILSNSGSVCIPKYLGVDACIHDGFVTFLNLPVEMPKDFLFHYFNYIRPFVINENRQGITQVNLNTNIVKEIALPLPPLPEQHRIVAKIEQLFSRIDAGIASLKKAQEQLKTYRQAVLKAAFEGKLTEVWRKENQIPEKSNGDLPSGWKLIQLDQVAGAVDPQPSHRTPPKVDRGVPYIGVKEIDYDNNCIEFNKARIVSKTVLEEHKNRYKLREGDFVIGKIGTIGKPFKVPSKQGYTLSANVVLIQPNNTKIDPDYLVYLMQSNFIEKEFFLGKKATTQAAFGIQKVRKLPIPLCSVEEQKALIDILESVFSTIKDLNSTITISLCNANITKQSLLKSAFEGKLVPQDPKDEPAEKLLERIKTEKEKVAALVKPKKKLFEEKRRINKYDSSNPCNQSLELLSHPKG